jgi:hypothetical protein
MGMEYDEAAEDEEKIHAGVAERENLTEGKGPVCVPAMNRAMAEQDHHGGDTAAGLQPLQLIVSLSLNRWRTRYYAHVVYWPCGFHRGPISSVDSKFSQGIPPMRLSCRSAE